MKQFNLAEYLQNPERKVVTREGYAVTIVSTTFYQENYPIVAEVCFSSYDKKQSYSFTANGLFLDSSEDSRDLFFAPEKHEGWINLYKCDNSIGCYVSNPFSSEEKAIEAGKTSNSYLKTVKIEWEEQFVDSQNYLIFRLLKR